MEVTAKGEFIILKLNNAWIVEERWKENTSVFFPSDQLFYISRTNWKKHNGNSTDAPNWNWDVKNKWREREWMRGKKVISTSKNAINISFDFLFASNHMITGAISIDSNGTRTNIRATAQEKNLSTIHRIFIGEQ